MTAPGPARLHQPSRQPEGDGGRVDAICESEHENAEGDWTCTLEPGHHGQHEARDEHSCEVPGCELTVHASWGEQTTEESETLALDVVYAWLGGGEAARQYLLEPRYRALVSAIAVELDVCRGLPRRTEATR